MKLDEMKVQYDRTRDGFTHESDFAVKAEKPLPKVDISGIAVKVGLCVGVLALAFIVRAFGVGAPQPKTAEVSSVSDGTAESDNDQPGRLHYVEATGTKWAAPVRASDIELIADGQLLRFTAGGGSVASCMDGSVLAVGVDERFGSYIRIQSKNDVETVYYGLDTVAVQEGAAVRAGDTLGTVPAGRSLYMKVYENGAPQDPTAFVDLSLSHE
jgi:murein DD-endopeptidase MepM/ murein hydrolase activator NlpD